MTIKKGSFITLHLRSGSITGEVTEAWEDAFNVEIAGKKYYRYLIDTDYTLATEVDFYRSIKELIAEYKANSTSKRKQAADYNRSTDGAAVARKGKVEYFSDGRIAPWENSVSVIHRELLRDAKQANAIVDVLKKRMTERKLSLQRMGGDPELMKLLKVKTA